MTDNSNGRLLWHCGSLGSDIFQREMEGLAFVFMQTDLFNLSLQSMVSMNSQPAYPKKSCNAQPFLVSLFFPL